jgi:hypothetical protein
MNEVVRIGGCVRRVSKILFVFGFALIALCVSASMSAAQTGFSSNQPEDMTSIMDTLSKLPPKLREELMAESQQVKGICASKQFFSSFHDCDCISLQFLARRLTLGPEPTQGLLLFEVSKMCVNRIGAAGYSYNYCLHALQPLAGKIGAACTCVARKMVKDYEAAPNPNVHYVRNLYMNGIESCKLQNYIQTPVEELYKQEYGVKDVPTKKTDGSYRPQ